MMSINYYDELNLDRNSSVAEINRALNQLETTWKRREVNTPEKATKMLSLIIDARTVFKTEETKRKYDESFNNKLESTNDSKVSKYVDARNKALSFVESNQWDLAKLSVDTMLPYLDSVQLDKDEHIEAYKLAVKVYSKNGLYENVLETANKIIMTYPDELLGYTAKEIALRNLLNNAKSYDTNYNNTVNTYRNTCMLLIKKADLQGNTTLAENTLYCYSISYINHSPQDYDKAEEYANELLRRSPENSGAKQVLDWLNQPQTVSIDELERYDSEQSPFEDTIIQMIEYIVNNNIAPKDSDGWILSKKSYFGHYNPNKDGFDEEDTTNMTFYLNTRGKLIKRKIYEEEIYYNHGNGLPSKNQKTDENECSLNDVMIEMDFSGRINYDPDSSFHEHGNLIEYVRFAKYKKNGQSVTLSRLYRKKGQGLYNFLNEIVSKAKKYEEECERINSLYNAEVAPLIDEIEKKYEPINQSLIQERDTQLNKAKANEERYNSIKSNITSLRIELSSLGFFAGKKKREFQSQIDRLEQELASIITVTMVTQEYKEKINMVVSQKNNEIRSVEERIRRKYPLPVR